MKSRKEFVIDIVTIKITKVSGEKKRTREAERERRIAETRFVCIPGARPVIIPKIIPIKRERSNSISILNSELSLHLVAIFLCNLRVFQLFQLKSLSLFYFEDKTG